MNISRIFTLCSALTLLSTSLCHAFWPLPTSRDVVVAGSAAIGTFALVRGYYLGQERRITGAIRTENDATRAAVLNQGQETRNFVETTGQTLETAVNLTHADVRRVGGQTNMLLNQNETLAQMLLAIHQDQQRILASQRRIEENTLGKLTDTTHNLLEDAQLSSSQEPLNRRYPVQISALAAKIDSKCLNNLPTLPLQKTVPIVRKEQALPSLKTFRAYGSTHDTSVSGRLGDSFSAIRNVFWKNNQN